MKEKHIFLSTFFLVFFAELGDKTQIASFSMAAKSGNILSVAIGASLALIASSLLAVVVGHKLALMLPKPVLKYLSGFLFIGTGVYIFVRIFFNF